MLNGLALQFFFSDIHPISGRNILYIVSFWEVFHMHEKNTNYTIYVYERNMPQKFVCHAIVHWCDIIAPLQRNTHILFMLAFCIYCR